MADLIGQQIGSYRLIRQLGKGGFATVYLGQNVDDNTQAAIKVLETQLPSEEKEKFIKQMSNVARLNHPHLVRILDFGVKDNTPFIVMTYAPNGSLRQHDPKGSTVPLATVISYVWQVAEALQYIHDHKMVHRDVKPENMLLG